MSSLRDLPWSEEIREAQASAIEWFDSEITLCCTLLKTQGTFRG